MFFSGQATLLLNKLENALRDEAKPAAWKTSLRKQPAFRDATTTITHHYPDLSNASDWLKQISDAARPIRSSIQIWVVTRHQYGISAVVLKRRFLGKPLVASRNVGCFLRLHERLDGRLSRMVQTHIRNVTLR